MNMQSKPNIEEPKFLSSADAATVVGPDLDELMRLWRVKRGEEAPGAPTLDSDLKAATLSIHRALYQRNMGRQVLDAGERARHATYSWMVAEVDGRLEGDVLFAAEFRFGARANFNALDYAPRLQHEMLVTGAKQTALSVITGDGEWFQTAIRADRLYQHLLLSAEKSFWGCVVAGEPPELFSILTKPRREGAQSTASNSAGTARGGRDA